MSARGLLLVLVDPAPALEEELNDWYDTEHLPERAALPGFLTALRFTSLGDGPRYAAVYDLESPGVLDGGAYRAVSGANFSPWTKRITARAHPARMTARQVAGDAGVTGGATRLLLVRFAPAGAADAGAIAAGLEASFGSESGLERWRIFEGVEPAPGYLLALAEFSGDRVPPLALPAFGDRAGKITLCAGYRPYRG